MAAHQRSGAALAAALVLGATDALARAGGGGHSGGGGGGHGGGFSGGGFSIGGGHGFYAGSSDSSGLGFLIFLLFVIIVLRILYRGWRRQQGDTTGAAPVPTTARPPERPGLPAAIAMIQSRDPDFELETFLQRAEMAFFLVRRGLQRNEVAAVRPYVDDALFAQVSANITQLTARHQHQLLESLNVRAVHLTDASCTDQRQTLQVHFDLVYRSKVLGEKNEVLQDEGDDRRHAERWTFARAANAKTPASGGVTASRCPACGAELRLALDGTCTHCRASVTSGELDWVVVAVQPASFVGYPSDSQFAVVAPTVGAGIDNLRQADPAFDINVFRTRVQKAFLALQDAWCRQQLDAGRAFLSPGAYFAWSAQLETMAAEGRRNVMEHLTVTNIAPMRVVHGKVFDDLTVRIFASSADYEVDAAGNVVFGDKTVRPFIEHWTFQRSVAVTTSAKPGTLENTCPNCGAPLEVTQIGECRYCRAAVTSGKFDWVVSRIEQEDAAPGGGSRDDDDDDDIGSQLTAAVGGAIVGGLLSSLLSGDRSS